MKKTILFVASFFLVLAMLPAMATQASAAVYDADATLTYAEQNWDNGIGVCDQFVKACLAAGDVYVYAGDVKPVMDALLDAGYGESATQLTISADGYYVLESENEGKTAPGDVMFFYCRECDDWTHTVMVAGYNSKGHLTIHGHNPAQYSYEYLGTFYHETEDGMKHDDLEVWVVNMSTEDPGHDHVLWYDTEGNFVGKYEDEHPHEMYDFCMVDGCDLKYHLGWTATVTTCPVCNPSPNGYPEVTLTLPDTGGVKVSWTALEDVAEYQVWRAKSEGGTFYQIPYTGTGAYMTNSAVTEGATYYYKVIAVLENGETVEGNVASVTVGGQLPKPELVVVVNEDYDAVLSWNEVDGADGYEVYRSTSEDGEYTLMVTTGPTTLSYTNTSTYPGNVYYYKVVALIGSDTTESDIKSIYYTEGMTTSGKPEVTLSITEAGAVKVQWTTLAGEGNMYQVLRAKSKDGTYYQIGSDTQYASMTNSAVIAGVTYYYKVAAVLPDGNKVTGDAEGITVPGTPVAPVLTVTASADNYPSLSWTAVTGADGYHVFRSTSEDGEYTKLITTASTAYTNSAVVAGQTYYYKVATKFGETLAMSEPQKFSYPENAMTISGKPEVSLSLNDNGGVQVNWTALDEVSEYQVWRSKREFGTYYQMGDSYTGAQMTNSSVLPGVGYYYKVIAVMNNGDEIYSDPALIMTAGDTACPVLTVTLDSDGNAALSWTAASNADGYQVFRATEAGGEYTSMMITAPTTRAYTNTGVEAGVTYYYKVASIFGDTLGDSNIVSVTITAADSPEVELSITDDGAVKLIWAEMANVSEYQVWRAKSEDGTYYQIGSGTPYSSMTNSNVIPGVIYYYKIIAVLKDGSEVSSTVKSIQVPGELNKPELTITLNESKKPVLTWTAVEGADGYEVFRATEENGDYTSMLTTANLTYTNTGAEPNMTYYYKVEALFGAVSSSSDAVSVFCPAVLDAPTIKVTNNATTGKPYISWTAVEGATGYKVYYSTSSTGEFKWLYTAAADRLYVNHSGTSAVLGNAYYYKVCAVKDGVNGAYSDVKGVWVDLPRPAVSVTNRASDGKPTISWTAVEGATGYKVYRCGTSGGTYTLLYTADANKLSVTHTGAYVGNDYFYKVKAIYGDNSSCDSALTAAKGVWVDLKQPTIKVLNSVSSGKPVISWGKVDYAVGYKVYCATGSSTGTYKLIYSTTNPDKLSVTHVGAKAGEAYFYKVVAVHKNSKCTSAYSTAKGVYCDLARPSLAVELNSKGKPYLSWTEVDGADGYKVYRSTDGSSWTLMYTAKADDFDVNHTGAISGTTYYYKVFAVCNATSKGNSAYSAVQSITVE